MINKIKNFAIGGVLGILILLTGMILNNTILKDTYSKAFDYWYSPPLIKILLFPFYFGSDTANFNDTAEVIIGIIILIITYGLLFMLASTLIKRLLRGK